MNFNFILQEPEALLFIVPMMALALLTAVFAMEREDKNVSK